MRVRDLETDVRVQNNTVHSNQNLSSSVEQYHVCWDFMDLLENIKF